MFLRIFSGFLRIIWDSTRFLQIFEKLRFHMDNFSMFLWDFLRIIWDSARFLQFFLCCDIILTIFDVFTEFSGIFKNVLGIFRSRFIEKFHQLGMNLTSFSFAFYEFQMIHTKINIAFSMY